MRDPHDVARAHAFARILGFLYTDGSASFSDKSHGYRGHLYFGHVIDVNQAVNDFELVTGKRLTYATPPEQHNYHMVR